MPVKQPTQATQARRSAHKKREQMPTGVHRQQQLAFIQAIIR